MSTAEGLVRIDCDGLSAAIDPHGAQLMSLRDAERELLWQGNPDWWPDRALILFPLIGPAVDGGIRHDGRMYPMPAHGFARSRDFAVSERSDARCVFELRDDAGTRAHYPFPFALRVSFEVSDRSLVNVITVENPGGEPLPADVGFHPGFNWPLEVGRDKEEYSITFADAEPASIRRGTGDPILLYPDARPTPVEGRALRLRDELFEELAIVWDRLNSRSLTYGAPGGSALQIDFPHSPHLGIWMIPGATYVCIEPWQGYPSPMDFQGSLSEKPGIALVEPGDTSSWVMRVTVLDDGGTA